MSKRLRQSGPLSHFLFSLVTEGLARMASKVMKMGDYKGFKVNNAMEFQPLQFADDTVLIGEGSWDNLWCIKALLRGFKLASGVNVKLFMNSEIHPLELMCHKTGYQYLK